MPKKKNLRARCLDMGASCQACRRCLELSTKSDHPHERGRKAQVKCLGERLEAPGILKNAVPVEALYDREAAFKHSLQNLLERQGYASLDAVRAEGEACGLGPLRRQVERRLDRLLTETEGAELMRRLGSLGPDRLGDVVLDFAAAEPAAWRANPNAR